MKFYLTRGVIVLAIVVVVLAAYMVQSRGSITTYDANVKLLVDQPSQVALPGGAASVSKIQQLIPTYAQIITSYSTAEEVAKRVPDVSPEEVQGSLSADAIEKTMMLDIWSHSNDPDKAQAIATEASNVLSDNINSESIKYNVKPEDRMTFSMIEPASVHANVPARGRMLSIITAMSVLVSVSGIAVFENARRS